MADVATEIDKFWRMLEMPLASSRQKKTRIASAMQRPADNRHVWEELVDVYTGTWKERLEQFLLELPHRMLRTTVLLCSFWSSFSLILIVRIRMGIFQSFVQLTFTSREIGMPHMAVFTPFGMVPYQIRFHPRTLWRPSFRACTYPFLR